ncbi:hypothetical protein DXG01_000067 [Tephrocybe rancida]|nr:hypothetical protein DXG01_000067 [Tephrocybe rancida]
MVDRSSHVNSIRMASSVSYPGYIHVSIPSTRQNDAASSAATPMAFQLPPLPCASSLQLRSFIDTTTTSPVGQTSRLLSLRNLATKMQTKTQEQEVDASPQNSPTGNNRRMSTPSFMHPNSPYVPWTPEMRRQILHPVGEPSPITDFYACRYSHTALQNLDPAPLALCRSRNLPKRSKLPRSFKNLTSAIGKNVKQVANRISRHKKKPRPTSSLPEPGPISHMALSNSFDSTDAITLSTWLSDRQRLRMERDDQVSVKEITLEEYEAMGSWTQLPKTSVANPDHLHNMPLAVLSDSPACWSRSLSRVRQRSVSLAEGFPKLASSHSGYLRGTLSRCNREMSMPGGWIFG